MGRYSLFTDWLVTVNVKCQRKWSVKCLKLSFLVLFLWTITVAKRSVEFVIFNPKESLWIVFIIVIFNYIIKQQCRLNSILMKLKSVSLRSVENKLVDLRFVSKWLLWNTCAISVNLRCVGGEVGATSSLAPKIGPLGLVSRISLTLSRYHNLKS